MDVPTIPGDTEKDNNGILIALGIGGGLTILLLIVVVILVIVFVPQSGGREGAFCRQQDQCARGYICSAGICAPGLGAPCSNMCAMGYECVTVPGTNNKICNAAPMVTTSFPVGNTTVNQVTKATAAGVNQKVIAERYLNRENLPQGLPPRSVRTARTANNSAFVVTATNGGTQQSNALYANSYTAPKSATYAEPMFKHLVRPLELKSDSSASENPSSYYSSDDCAKSLSIYSGDSYNESSCSPSPYNGKPMTCNKSPIHYKGKVINFKDTKFETQQVDIIYYSDKYIVLLRNGNFICENKSSKSVSQTLSSIPMTRIVVFNGYIYGLSNGTLFKLDMTSFLSPVWRWNKIPDMVQNVWYISTTLNMEYLWVQTADNRGYLFDCKFEIIEEADVMEGTYRVYGMNKSNYIIVDTTARTATSYPAQYVIPNVSDAALAHDNQVVTCEDPNRLVRIVNWKVAYPYRPGMLPDISCN
jgi:hypothetical protein